MKYAVTSIETQTNQEYSYRRTNPEPLRNLSSDILPRSNSIKYSPKYSPNFSRTPKPMATNRVTVMYDLDSTVLPTTQTGKIILNYLMMGGDPGQNVQTCMFDEEGYELEEPISLYSVNSLRDEIAKLGDYVFVYSKRFEEDDDKIYAWNTLIDFIDRQPDRIVYSELKKNLKAFLAEILGEDQVDDVVEVLEERVPAPTRSTAPIRHSGVRSYSKNLRQPEKKIVRIAPNEEIISRKKRVTSPGKRSEEDDFYEDERYTTMPSRSPSRSLSRSATPVPPRIAGNRPSSPSSYGSYSMSPR